MNHLETAQNNVLRLICGAVKTTPVTALQIIVGIQKLAAAYFIKLQASSWASWINQHTPHQTIRTQPTPVNNCQNLKNLMNIPTQIEPIIPATNPFDLMTVATKLSLTEDLKKKDASPVILNLTTFEMIDLHYPEKDCFRVYTDGFQVDETYSWSRSMTIGVNKSNFNGEIEAICLAVQQLLDRLQVFEKVVILVDSKAAIQAVSSISQPKSKKINDIKQALKHLQAFKKIVIFQWFPSHVGLEGSEIADKLATKGTTLFAKETHTHAA
jgi:ribonuclease HI